MHDDDLGTIAATDQGCAVARDFARSIATYYHTLRREGVPASAAFPLTMQWQAAHLARIFGLGRDDA